jgi:molybdate transport system substrate-binding protein
VIAVLLIAAVMSTGASLAWAAPPGGGGTRRTLVVAAASDLRFALSEIVARFEAAHDVTVQLTFGSSGWLAAQIEHGAPFDLFLSADEPLVARLADAGAIRRDTIRVYAEGRIVLWVRTDSALEIANWTAAVTDPRVRFLAIANPVRAPYGRAAEQALRAAGVHARVRAKIVMADDVSQTLQLVQSGNADAGMVAASLAVAPPVTGTGRYQTIPARLHQPIRQSLGVVARARERDAAGALAAFLTSPIGRAILRRHAFVIPGEP